MATSRRPPRTVPAKRPNPLRELFAEKQRASEIARSRQRVQQLKTDLPSLIQDRVGEQMSRLESKLLDDFKEMGQKAMEESTAVLSEQLSGRIQTLEEISAIQSETLMNLRDSSQVAERKVSAVVNSIEQSLANAVPGFRLEPPAHPPLPPPSAPADAYGHPQFQLPPPVEVIKLDPQDVSEIVSKNGYCPNCTSVNVRRANRSGLFEQFLRLFFIAPFRCRACRHKFYRF